MIAKKLLLITTVTAVLAMQLNPVQSSRKAKILQNEIDEVQDQTGTGTGTGTGTSTGTGTARRRIDAVCLLNFGIQAGFDFMVQFLAALGACLPCDRGAASCTACFASNALARPDVPMDCGL